MPPPAIHSVVVFATVASGTELILLSCLWVDIDRVHTTQLAHIAGGRGGSCRRGGNRDVRRRSSGGISARQGTPTASPIVVYWPLVAIFTHARSSGSVVVAGTVCRLGVVVVHPVVVLSTMASTAEFERFSCLRVHIHSLHTAELAHAERNGAMKRRSARVGGIRNDRRHR